MKSKLILSAIVFVSLFFTQSITADAQTSKWSEEKVWEWYNSHEWLSGTNFIPSTAVNSIEMWRAETFDAETIDRELGWAEDLGFNFMRVYLNSLVWKHDPEGFKERIDQYLAIADKHGIGTMFVFFDDCWNPDPAFGPQPEPKTGVHNSGWIQDPGKEARQDTASLYPWLEDYVKDIISTFKNDDRVLVWDMYNEPGNSKYGSSSLPLLKNAFEWALEVIPSQPLTAGIWNLELEELNKFQISNSDIITYHNYMGKANHRLWIKLLKTHGRPLMCTEWMARNRNSKFQNLMPLLKEENVAALSWGFVAGDTNTIYAWNDPKPEGGEPELWFHDILRKDGTPYDPEEIEIIKKLNGVEE